MRTFGKWVLAFGLIAAGVGSGRSEEPAKKGGRIIAEEGAVELMLLRQQSVQDELKLSKDQVDQIDAFAEGQWKKAQDIHQLEPEKAKPKWEELGKANEKFIADTLKPEQHKRLEQIGMHVAGVIWVLDPKVSKGLSLTDDQKTKIRELHKAARKEVEEVMHSADKAGREGKMEELKKAHRKELYAILTEEQKAKWKEMAGEPFKGKIHFVGMDPEKK
jgi:Spy/CpxP family protein refolding chaperone